MTKYLKYLRAQLQINLPLQNEMSGKLLENSTLQCNKYFIVNSIWWLCDLSTWHKVSQCPAPWEQCRSSWRVSSVQCSQCPYPPEVEVYIYINNVVYSCLYSHANQRFQFALHKAVSWCAKHQRDTKRRPIQLFFLNCKYITINKYLLHLTRPYPYDITLRMGEFFCVMETVFCGANMLISVRSQISRSLKVSAIILYAAATSTWKAKPVG